MLKKIIKIIANGCKGLCGDELVERYISPDGASMATYFIRDCGGTTGFVDHVEIDGKEILLSEAKDGKGSALQISWVNDRMLSVGVATSTHDLRIYRQPVFRYHDIDIQYSQKIIDSYQKWNSKSL